MVAGFREDHGSVVSASSALVSHKDYCIKLKLGNYSACHQIAKPGCLSTATPQLATSPKMACQQLHRVQERFVRPALPQSTLPSAPLQSESENVLVHLYQPTCTFIGNHLNLVDAAGEIPDRRITNAVLHFR
jgi:hypothetical protein